MQLDGWKIPLPKAIVVIMIIAVLLSFMLMLNPEIHPSLSTLLSKDILKSDQAFQKNTGFLFVQIYIMLLLSHRCSPFHHHYRRSKRFHQCCEML